MTVLKPVSNLPEETRSLLGQILDKMKNAKRVQLVGHLRPDGDCIGSLLGLHAILAHYGVEHAMAAEEHTYPGYKQMPGYKLIDTSPRENFDADLTIYSDCGDPKRAFADWKPTGYVINIDHHRSNPMYGDLNWVDAECAAVGEMIYDLAAEAKIPVDSDFANALLLAIMTDTGCFRFSSVRPHHFEMAAELMRAGGDVTLISRAAYEGRTRESVGLGSAVLSKIQYEADGALAWAEVTIEMLERVGGPQHMPENLVSEIRSIDGVKASLLIIESNTAALRASMRGDGSVNVAAVAQTMGGGGHFNAAGLTVIEGDYTTLKKQLIETLRLAVEEANRVSEKAPA